MKIGFDISQTGLNKAGCGFFASSLISALLQKDQENKYLLYPFFGSDYHDEGVEKGMDRFIASNSQFIRIGKKLEKAKQFWSVFPANGEERMGDPDILHANNFFCPTNLNRAKLVYTLYDVAFLDYPEFTTELNRWICFRGIQNASLYADFFIAISASSRDRFLHYFPYVPEDRIRVIYPANRFDPEHESAQKAGIVPELTPGNFFLTVCTLEPRKNIRRLLTAYKIFRERNRNRDLPIVLAGGQGWLESDLNDFIRELGITDSVRMTGYVSDETLAWLYRECFAFLYPSIYEGFGLPVLEAMSFGAPVVTADSTSLPEVAGDAAIFVNPFEVEEMAGALETLAENEHLRNKLKAAGPERAKRFSWERAAGEVLSVYYEVAALPGRRTS